MKPILMELSGESIETNPIHDNLLSIYVSKMINQAVTPVQIKKMKQKYPSLFLGADDQDIASKIAAWVTKGTGIIDKTIDSLTKVKGLTQPTITPEDGGSYDPKEDIKDEKAKMFDTIKPFILPAAGLGLFMLVSALKD